MKIVEHSSEKLISERSATTTIEWTVNNNEVHNSEGFKVNAGGTVRVLIGINPNDKTVTVGIKKADGTISFVKGKDFISHTFSISKTGTYQLFVKNDSGKKVKVSGTYIYSN